MAVTRSMDSVSSDAVASWIDTLNASVIPMRPRGALRNLIVEREITGRAFSMVLNGHALADFNLPDVSLAMATKIRKCWHADFPESVSIKAPVSVRAEDQGQRHDPCQDGVDYSGYEGYAGYKPGLRTGTARSGVGQGSAGGREAASGRSGHPPLSSSMKSSKRTLPMVTISLDVMRSALDSVAERADLNRQDVYLGLRDVIPDEVWEPLWASYTSDLVREHSNDAQASMDLHRNAKAPRTSDKSNAMLVKQARDAPSSPGAYVARQVENQREPSQAFRPQDELAYLPELRTRLEGPRQCAPEPQPLHLTQQDCEVEDDVHSNAETLRSEAETMASDAMSHWLGKAGVNRARLSPFEIAHWLRMLPKDRLKEDTLKTIAKQVLDKSMDEDEFGAAIAVGLESFGLSDQREAMVLQRYYKQRQNEAAMAEAAKQEGALIRKFNAKLEAKVWQA